MSASVVWVNRIRGTCRSIMEPGFNLVCCIGRRFNEGVAVQAFPPAALNANGSEIGYKVHENTVLATKPWALIK